MRGENSLLAFNIILIIGTSPHAWGKLLKIAAGLLAMRNIPTCVGKTKNRLSVAERATEHPHMRGENERAAKDAIAKSGTSPHAWGKLCL